MESARDILLKNAVRRTRRGALLCALLCAASFVPGAALAESASALPLPRAALTDLARQFVDKIGGGMRRADEAMGGGGAAKKSAAPASDIPDGSELILQARVGRHTLAGDIVALKDKGTLFLSLRDFFAVLGFPVRLDPEEGRAEGWFIREDRLFLLDARAGTVRAGDKNFSIQPGALREEGGEWMVGLDTLGAWFGMTFQPDYARQAVTIDSESPLPIEEQELRRRRKFAESSGVPAARLPRREPEWRLADSPFVDLSLTGSQRQAANSGRVTRSLNYSALVSGDLAGMTAKAYAGGSLREGPTSLRATFERNSEEPELLGPAGARQVALGDVGVVDLPLVEGRGQEQGAFVTNRKKGESVTFATALIDGDAQTGWDVELYRENQLVGFQTVDESGRYAFPDVRLFSGANDFRLVFYGPQGEVREERRDIPVDLSAVGAGGGFYDVSLTRNDKITYRKFSSNDTDEGTPHFAARYEKSIGESLVASGGVRLREEEGAQKTYLAAGLSALVADTFVNLNTAYDANGEAAAEAIARRAFGKQNVSVRTQVNTDGYAPDSDSEDPTVLDTEAAASGLLANWNGGSLGYELEAGYFETASGQDALRLGQNVNAAIGPARLSNTLSYQERFGRSDADGNAEEAEILDNFAATALLGKDRLRLATIYEIEPEPGMRSALASWARKYSDTLRSEIEVEHFLEDSLTEVEASLNWTHENVTLGPRIEYGTDGKFGVSLAARTGLAKDPAGSGIRMSGRPIAGAGGLSAKVFIDSDGDGVFSEGDEPVEGVMVEAVQSRRKEKTGADGTVFLTGLIEAKATDVTLDGATFPDPYLIRGSEGFSFTPRPGRVAEASFPLHRAGELDGTVSLSFEDEKGASSRPAAGLRLYLYDSSGKKAAFTKTSYDGFYLFSLVPPGRYKLLPDEEDLRLLRAESPLPKDIVIGYDGTVFSGVDMTLASGKNPVTIGVSGDFREFLDAHADSIAPGAAGSSVFLDLGDYGSQVTMALVWYRLKTRYGALVDDSDLLVKPTRSLPDSKGRYRLRLRPATEDLEALRRRCRAIAARGVTCRISILPEGLAERTQEKSAKSPT